MSPQITQGRRIVQGRTPTVDAGTLKDRVTIQSVTETRSSSGQVNETWGTFATRWASVEPLQGREFFESQQVNADVTTRVRLRYLEGVTPKMRVLYKTRTFNITSVVNVEERSIETQLLCTEDV